MTLQIISLAVLALVFLVATWKPIHLGLLAMVAAFGVGLFIAGESIDQVMEGFPVNLLILLVGVTYLFAIAREAGVVDWVIQKAIRLVRGNVAMLPWVFFFMAVLVAAMGSPLACVALSPVAMFFVTRHRIDPVLMGLAVVIGGVAGGFAPTSLFGLITNGIAANSGIPAEPVFLFLTALGYNVAAMMVAYVLFGGIGLIRRTRTDRESGPSAPLDGGATLGGPGSLAADMRTTGTLFTPGAVQQGTLVMEKEILAPAQVDPASSPAPLKLTTFQKVALLSLALLIGLVITLSVLDVETDVGVIALSLAVLVTLAYPEQTKPALKGIDWSTVLLVGGIITYAGVLQRVGAIDMLGDAAATISQPFWAALIICLIGAFVSAFASTTGILGALIPLSLPLIATGQFEGYGLIVALAISSSLVDSTPFSTAGAAAVAGAPETARPRLTKILMRWGLSMIVVGPVVTVSLLVLPAVLV